MAINDLDIESVLEKLSSLNYVRLHKRRDNWYSIYCPFHNDGNERRASFGVSVVAEYRNGVEYPLGFCHCFTCGYAKPLEEFISDILSKHGVPMTGKEWLSDNVEGYDSESEFEYLLPDGLMSSIYNKYALDNISSKLNESVTYVSEDELATYRYVVPYMYERKLTDEIIDKYDIGFDPNFIPPGRVRKVPCITFPVRDKEGRTLFLCRRSIQGKMYNYPEGVIKPVYGIDMIPKGTRSVIVCESCINALTCVVYGYAAVALLGTGNTYQMRQLKELGVQEFILAFDGDDAGRRATERFKKNLKSVSVIWTIPIPEGKDVNDLTKEEFDECYKRRY